MRRDELLGNAGASSEVRVESLRLLLVFVGLFAVGASVWAVATDAWKPLLIVIPLILALPPQVRRWQSASRSGYGLVLGVVGGLTFGLMGWINGGSGLHVVSSGLVVGVFIGLGAALMWGRRSPRWRRSRLNPLR